MENIIRDMLAYADNMDNPAGSRETVARFVSEIINELLQYDSIPWWSIGYTLANEWNHGTWEYDSSYETGSLYDILNLGDYGADECFGVAAFDNDGED